jgi:hypothetical protein
MGKDDVYQAFLKSNPTALIDYRGHLKDSEGKNIFTNKEKFAGYAAGLLASKTRDVEGNKIDLQADRDYIAGTGTRGGGKPKAITPTYSQEADKINIPVPFESYKAYTISSLSGAVTANQKQYADNLLIRSLANNKELSNDKEVLESLNKEATLENKYNTSLAKYKIIPGSDGKAKSIDELKNDVKRLVLENKDNWRGDMKTYNKLWSDFIGKNKQFVGASSQLGKDLESYAKDLFGVYSSNGYKKLETYMDKVMKNGVEIDDKKFILVDNKETQGELDNIARAMNLNNYNIIVGGKTAKIAANNNKIQIDDKSYEYNDIKFGGIQHADPELGLPTTLRIQVGGKDLYLTPKKEMGMSITDNAGNPILNVDDEIERMISKLSPTEQALYLQQKAKYNNMKQQGYYFN